MSTEGVVDASNSKGLNPFNFIDNLLFPGAGTLAGGLIGALSGVLNKGNDLGNTGYGLNRLEDRITTEALGKMNVNQARIQNQNPESQRKMTEGRINTAQGAATAAALNASAGINANNALGGDAAIPMGAALTNNSAAINAAAPYAQQLAQNDQFAMQARQQQDAQLQQLANEYGNQASHVNLIAAGQGNANLDLSSRIRRGLLGLNEGATVFGNLRDSLGSGDIDLNTVKPNKKGLATTGTTTTSSET